MSRPPPPDGRQPGPSRVSTSRRPLAVRTLSGSNVRPVTRRPSLSGLGLANSLSAVSGAPKAQRTSKTTQKLVLLPTAPQTRPLPIEEEDEVAHHGYETDTGARDTKSAGERMTKAQREDAGFSRLTAYCVARELKMKVLAGFLKREHNVQPRMFDEAMYVMYHLPLLPGYGPHANIRSSAPPSSEDGEDPTSGFSEAEEDGYQGTYFNASTTPPADTAIEGYITSPEVHSRARTRRKELRPTAFAEAIFFAYGVVVFFGFTEEQERGILEDIEGADGCRDLMKEADWEIEQCHYATDPNIIYPRVYNDFFTFKTHSHLLKLSVAHALAQSTLLARYESHTQAVLSSPRTVSIPVQLAATGSLALSRTEALRLTGRLFSLKRDVNLAGTVLDVPELFWSEASLKALYDAVREYMEIGSRVQVLNEKLAVAEDLLGAIHDHLNNNAMERITWIIIWLIVVACVVEVGEVVARLVVHAGSSSESLTASMLAAMPREEALRILDRMTPGSI